MSMNKDHRLQVLVTDALAARLRQAAASQRSQQIWKSAFLALVDKNADGVMVVNFDGIICFVNPAAAALLDRATDELIGQPFGTPILPGEASELDGLERVDARRVALAGTVMDGCDLRQDL